MRMRHRPSARRLFLLSPLIAFLFQSLSTMVNSGRFFHLRLTSWFPL
jgi:hypothetical protein